MVEHSESALNTTRNRLYCANNYALQRQKIIYDIKCIVYQKMKWVETKNKTLENIVFSRVFNVLSDSRYAMSGLHHYTGKPEQKMPAGSENELAGMAVFSNQLSIYL